MEAGILIWLYLSLGNLAHALTQAAIIPSILLFIYFMCILVIAIEKGEVRERTITFKNKLPVKLSIWFLVLTVMVNTFYPDKEDMSYILGGTALYSVSQVEGADKLPENVIGAINSFLEKMQEETK